MEEKRCAVVTGANKGIGIEICRQLALNKINVILTARSESRGIDAVRKLNAFGIENVAFHQLDINDPTSTLHLVKFIETNFKKLDILVNNAAIFGARYLVEKVSYMGGQAQIIDEKGILLPGIVEETYELAEECFETNYYGQKKITAALLPLLQLSKSPRIVNVTSYYGLLCHFPNEDLKKELDDIDNLTEEGIDEIIQRFLRDYKANKLQENGWPVATSVPAYCLSKAALNAWTRLLAKKYQNIVVNAVSTGFCKTDLTLFAGRHPLEGTKGPVMAALLPDQGPSGVHFRETIITPF